MPVKPEKQKALALKMEELEIFESDLVEKFILGSGKGGQKVNKSSTCVYLKHLPSGLQVKCQKGRSQDLNRYYARQELCEKLSALRSDHESEKEKEIYAIKRQKKRRSRRSKLKILEAKKKRGTVKLFRKKVEEE